MGNSSSQKDLTLYSYWRSSCSWRVRIALEMKNLKYQYIPIHLVKNEQLSEEFLELNPRGLVPCLIEGSGEQARALSESMAILIYLEEKYKGSRLLPKDPYEKAKVLRVCESINSGIQPLQNLATLRKIMEYFPAEKTNPEDKTKTEMKMEWGKHWIDQGFVAVEALLPDQGPYCFGNEVTLADVFLVPQVYNANRFKVDMSKFPKIAERCANLEKLPAFIRAHPDNQPDAQKPKL